MLAGYFLATSVSGTGRARGRKGAGLPGHFPAWLGLPDKHALWGRNA